MNITERFLKYVGYGTNSDEKSETCPSTPNQLVLGAAIAEELKSLGLTDVEQDADDISKDIFFPHGCSRQTLKAHSILLHK